MKGFDVKYLTYNFEIGIWDLEKVVVLQENHQLYFHFQFVVKVQGPKLVIISSWCNLLIRENSLRKVIVLRCVDLRTMTLPPALPPRFHNIYSRSLTIHPTFA